MFYKTPTISLGFAFSVFVPEVSCRKTFQELALLQCYAQGHFIRVDSCQLNQSPVEYPEKEGEREAGWKIHFEVSDHL